MTQEQVTEERNARRRARYQTDPDYREQVNDRNRQNYRESSGGVDLRDASNNLKILKGLGTKREVDGGDVILTFNAKEAAEVLDGYNEQFIYRCLRDGRLPPMLLEAHDEVDARHGKRKVSVKVYSEGEMRAIARIMSEHQQKYSYYRKSHTDTTNALFEAVEEFRV